MTQKSLQHLRTILFTQALLYPTLTLADTFTWQGDRNNNWGNERNWSQDPGSGDVPNQSSDNVIFNDTADRFSVDANGNIRDIGAFTINHSSNTSSGYLFTSGGINLYGDLTIASQGHNPVFDSTFSINVEDHTAWRITGTGDGPFATFNSSISGDKNINLIGWAKFTAANPFTGEMKTENPGSQLIISNPNAFQHAVVTHNGAGRITFEDDTTTLGVLRGTANSLSLGSTALTVGTKGANRTYTADITGTTFGDSSLTLAGDERLELSGDITGLKALTATSGELRLIGNTVALSGSATMDLSGGDIKLISGAVATLNSVAPTNGSIVKVNSNTFTLNGSQLTAARITSNTDGIVSLGNTSDGDALLTIGETGNTGATWAFDGTFTGNGNIEKVGDGDFTLTRASTLSGVVEINNGSVILEHTNALQNATIEVNISNGFELNGGDATISGLNGSGSFMLDETILTVGNNDRSSTYSGSISGTGSIHKIGTGNLTLANSSTYSGKTTIDSGAVILSNNSHNALQNSTVMINHANGLRLMGIRSSENITIGALAGSGSIDVRGYNLYLGRNNETTTYSGALSNVDILFKTGTGTLTLSGGNTYDGPTIISNGVIKLANAISLQNSKVRISVDNALDLNSLNPTIDNLEGSGNLDLGSSILTLSGNTSGANHSGVLSGSGKLIKNGTQSLSLSGANTFSGGITVNDGVLKVTNTSGSATGSGNVHINSGATLSGDGAVWGDVTVALEGTVDPEDTTSSLNFGGALNLNGQLNIHVNGATNDHAVVSGNLDISSATLALLPMNNGFTATVYQIADYGSLTGSTFATITGLPANYRIDYAYNNGSSSNNIALVRDDIQPVVASFTTTQSSPTNIDSITYLISFSEPVTGFNDHDDFSFVSTTATTDKPATTITNTGDGQNYSLTLNNISGDGTVQIQLLTSGVTDLVGNELGSSNILSPSVLIDNTAPSASYLTIQTTSPTNVDSLVYTITFSEPVFGLIDISDLQAAGDMAADFDFQSGEVNIQHIDNKVYTITFNGVEGDGIFRFQIKGGQVKDAAGNQLTFFPTSGGNFIIDNTAPVISLNASGTNVTLAVGESWIDPVSATDNIDANVTIVTGGDTLDMSTAGVYYLTYNASDLSGNTAEQLSRTVTVVSPFDTWANVNGLEGSDALLTADPDKDGRTNLEEFALDGDPMSGANDGKLVSQISTISTVDYLTVTFPVRAGAVFTDSPIQVAIVDNVVYTVEGSTDLIDWNESTVEVTPALTSGMPALSAGWEYRTFRFHQSVDASVRAFLQVKVIEAP